MLPFYMTDHDEINIPKYEMENFYNQEDASEH
jgi:hypothetical protein